jgi:hypothetical protein
VEELFPEFDNDERFVLGVIDFLEDIRWIEKVSDTDEYIITAKVNNQI